MLADCRVHKHNDTNQNREVQTYAQNPVFLTFLKVSLQAILVLNQVQTVGRKPKHHNNSNTKLCFQVYQQVTRHVSHIKHLPTTENWIPSETNSNALVHT